MGSGCAPQAYPIVSIARSWRAGCGRSGTASRAFLAWFATWRASLAKQVQLEIVGANTEVDREILDRLEAPLNHAIRNSLDHGIERPEERVAAGKPPSGTIRLEARHRAGLFVLTVSDDGRGVDIEALRAIVIAKGLATPEMAASFSEAELLEFLFLPGIFHRAKPSPISRAAASDSTPCRKWPSRWAAWLRSPRAQARG